MLTVTALSHSFGSIQVLKDLNFKIASDERIGIVGPSGSGKSVLLKCLCGVLHPKAGSVTSGEAGSDVTAITENRFGMLFQESALFDSMSVLENTAFPLMNNPAGKTAGQTLSREEIYSRAYEALRDVGLGEAALKLPGQLSGGMRRRAGIARAIVSRPQYLLLDDPTGGLDPVTAAVIMELISELQERYQTALVMVSHDIRRLLSKVDRLISLFQGEIVSDLPISEVPGALPPAVLRFLSTRYDFPSDVPSDGQLST